MFIVSSSLLMLKSYSAFISHADFYTGHIGAGSNPAIAAAASRAIGATLEVSLYLYFGYEQTSLKYNT